MLLVIPNMEKGDCPPFYKVPLAHVRKGLFVLAEMQQGWSLQGRGTHQYMPTELNSTKELPQTFTTDKLTADQHKTTVSLYTVVHYTYIGLLTSISGKK